MKFQSTLKPMTIEATSILLIFLIFLIFGVIFGLYHMSRDIAQWIRGYGIPYIHTPNIKIDLLLKNLNLGIWDVFIDIGCWDGPILEAVKNKFPSVKVIGYEKSYRPYLDALERRKRNWLNYEIRNEDFFLANITEATVLYSYMIPYMMERIWRKINSECKNGTILFSSSFAVDWKEPKKVLKLWSKRKILIYEVDWKEVKSG